MVSCRTTISQIHHPTQVSTTRAAGDRLSQPAGSAGLKLGLIGVLLGLFSTFRFSKIHRILLEYSDLL
jgi:hypothetical protein